MIDLDIVLVVFRKGLFDCYGECRNWLSKDNLFLICNKKCVFYCLGWNDIWLVVFNIVWLKLLFD